MLAQAEQLLRDQVAKLTLLQSEPRDKQAEDRGADREQTKDEKNNDANEAVTNTKKQTWGIGVLSNFIKQKQEVEEANNGADNEKKTWGVGVLSSFLKQKEGEKEEATNGNNDNTGLVCAQCNAKFSNHTHVLKDHIERKHLHLKYHCTHCNHDFLQKKKVFRHLKDETNSKDPSSLLLFQCGVCSKSEMGTRGDFVEHIQSKHPIFEEAYRYQIKPKWANGSSNVSEVKAVKLESSPSKPLDSESATPEDAKASKETTEENPQEDLTSFISKIESNLERYSKIINESKLPENENSEDFETEEKRGETEGKKGIMTATRENKREVEKKSYKCLYCPEDYTGRHNGSQYLSNHTESNHFRMCYVCRECGYELKTKSRMHEHIDMNHIRSNVDMKELLNIRSKFTMTKCLVCTERFDTRVDFANHMEKEHREMLFEKKEKYERCFKKKVEPPKELGKKKTPKLDPTGRVVSASRKKVTVDTMKQNQRGPRRSRRQLLKCPLCAFKASIFWNLKVHIGTHIGAKFSCTLCTDNFKRKFHIMEHIRDSHKEEYEKHAGNNKSLSDSYVTCSCEVCDISEQSVEDFDEHLYRVHELPAIGADIPDHV